MKIPDWEECLMAGEMNSQMNPLERFVFDYEPAGYVFSEKWNKDLQALVDYVEEQANGGK